MESEGIVYEKVKISEVLNLADPKTKNYLSDV